MKKLLFTLLIIVSSMTIKAQGLFPKTIAFDVKYSKLAPDMMVDVNSRRGMSVGLNYKWLNLTYAYGLGDVSNYNAYNVGVNILIIKELTITPKIGVVKVKDIYYFEDVRYREYYTKYDVSIDLKVNLFNSVYVVIGTGVTQKFCYGLGINF